MGTNAIAFYSSFADERNQIYSIASQFNITPIVIDANISEDNVICADGCYCVSVGHQVKITEAIIKKLASIHVKFLSTRSIGINHIDLAAAKKYGIIVQNVQYSPDDVADYTILLMLMVFRGMKTVIRTTSQNDYRLPANRGTHFPSLTVGVIGTGNIGQAVIHRLKSFGCHVIAYDVHPSAQATYVSLEEVVRSSDVLTLHIPLTEQTYHLIDRSQLAKMKSTAILINTARGELIDTEALIEALSQNKLGGAALDVVEMEDTFFYTRQNNMALAHPMIAELMRMPNVIITPHIAYFTESVLTETIQKSIMSCLKHMEGETENE